MKKAYILLLLFTLSCLLCNAQRKFKLSDTTGLASIEDDIETYKPILSDMTHKINGSDDINSIKKFAHIVEEENDTILSHILAIFDGYITLHPDQGETLKNISDLANRMMDCKDPGKAKKYNLKMIDEYANLMKEK